MRNCGGTGSSRKDIQVYSEMTDDDIVMMAKSGEETAMEFMLLKYRSLVRLIAGSYFLPGAEQEDILQEGMIGLFKAVRDYKTAGTQTALQQPQGFKYFAGICVRRQILMAIRAAARRKHRPLNSYLSLSAGMTETELLHIRPEWQQDSVKTLYGGAAGDAGLAGIGSKATFPYMSGPEEEIIEKEDLEQLKGKISGALSKFEKTVLSQYLMGKGYREIAVVLKKHAKSIDNALQRIKQKLRKVLL